MDLPAFKTIRIDRADDVVRVWLNRPDVRNAFDETMIEELTIAFRLFGDDASARAVVFGGTGDVFCAGADIDWMRRSVDRTEADNVRDARAMADMYRAIDHCPVPVIARVQKAAFGGALGFVAVCDVVVAAEDARFCFSEVRLGIVPAVISSFCIRKIGLSQARRYFATAEVFTAREAPAGLIHEVVPAEQIDAKIDGIVAALGECGPQAVREIKKLIPEIAALPQEQAIDLCARTIARVRVGEEAQAGLRAFLDKRQPPWKDSKGT